MSSNFTFNVITLRIGPFGNFFKKFSFFEKFVKKFSKCQTWMNLIKGKNFRFSNFAFFSRIEVPRFQKWKKKFWVQNFPGSIHGRATEATLRRWISLEPMKILTRGLREVLKIDLLYILTNFRRNRSSSFREKWKKPIFWPVFVDFTLNRIFFVFFGKSNRVSFFPLLMSNIVQSFRNIV